MNELREKDKSGNLVIVTVQGSGQWFEQLVSQSRQRAGGVAENRATGGPALGDDRPRGAAGREGALPRAAQDGGEGASVVVEEVLAVVVEEHVVGVLLQPDFVHSPSEAVVLRARLVSEPVVFFLDCVSPAAYLLVQNDSAYFDGGLSEHVDLELLFPHPGLHLASALLLLLDLLLQFFDFRVDFHDLRAHLCPPSESFFLALLADTRLVGEAAGQRVGHCCLVDAREVALF